MSVGTSSAILIGAGFAGAASVTGGLIQAGAQGGAAQAQLSASQQALQAQIQARAQAINQVTGISGLQPGEISSINQILTTKSQALNQSLASIAQQQSQLDAMNPQVKQSGQDLYDLLTGKASSVLAPMQQQLTRQRQELVNSLSSQLGPGFMTSSAGINALTQFDEQSAMTLQNAQMGAISTVASTYGSLAGMQNQGQNAVTTQTGEAFGRSMLADQSVLQANQFATNRQTNAVLGAMGATPIGFTGPTQFAGAPFAQSQGVGQTIAGAGNAFAGAMTLGTLAAGASPGGAAPGGNSFNPAPASGPTLGVNTDLSQFTGGGYNPYAYSNMFGAASR